MQIWISYNFLDFGWTKFKSNQILHQKMSQTFRVHQHKVLVYLHVQENCATLQYNAISRLNLIGKQLRHNGTAFFYFIIDL